MLDGDVDVFDDLRLRGDELYELVVELVGVEIVQAYPAQAVYLHELAQERGEARPAEEIETVVREVLGDEDELPVPALCQLSGLGQDVLHGPGAEAPAYLRDEAVGAVVVAAVRYEQVGPDPAGADDAPRLRDGGAVVAYYDRLLAPQRALQGRRHLVVAARADDGVHLRQLGDDLVPVELREAAGDDELFEPSRLLEPGRFEDGVYGLLLCVLYEGAGVYDDGLGLGLVVRELIARVRELFEHLLRGDPVLRAAEGDHAYLHSSNSNP